VAKLFKQINFLSGRMGRTVLTFIVWIQSCICRDRHHST